MKKTISVLFMILLLAGMLAAEDTRSNQLSKTDWLHITYPGMAYIAGEQLLETIGCSRETAEYASLAMVLAVNVAKEYNDSRSGGVSCMKDLELSIIGVATSYYINKGINAVLRGRETKYRRMDLVDGEVKE